MTPERHSEIVAQLRELFAKAAPLLAELDGRAGTLLDQYVDTCLHRRASEQVAFSDFYGRFKSWLPERERDNWTKGRVLQELPFKIRNEGRSDQPRRMIEGLSWQPEPPKPEPVKVDATPLNPDFDGAALYWVQDGLRKGGLRTYSEIAAKMNELGHRDENGQKWDAKSVEDHRWKWG